MSDFDRFARDQFPLRQSFRSLNALFSKYILGSRDVSGIYVAEGQAAKLDYPLNVSAVETAKAKFQSVYDQYLTKSHVFFAVVPDKGYYLAKRHGYPAMDYDGLFAQFQSLPFAQYVDLTDTLTASDYYATDLHWRQEQLRPAASRLCAALGIPEGVFTQRVLSEAFSGVYSGQSALPLTPDRLVILENEITAGCTVTIAGAESAVYNLEKLQSRDPYEVFLSGSVGVMTVQNPAAATGRELIVFRDSFGSSLVPLLLQGYERVTLLDLRYYPAGRLGDTVDFHGQDVLFLLSTTVLNTPGIFK